MAATIFGNGLTFGTTAESGGYLQNLEIQNKTEKADVRNETGEFVGVAFYNRTEEISGEAVLGGSAGGSGGLGAIAPAAALTLASYSPSAGSIYVDEVTTKYSNTGWKTTSFKAICYPLVTGSGGA